MARWLGPLVVAGCLCAAWAAPALAEDTDFRFGVFPYLPALTLDRLFGPMAVELGEALGCPVRLKTKPTFERFAEEVALQGYEVILVHPFFYVEAADQHGYVPIARVDLRLTAVVMVNEDRPWRTWRDLAHRTVALPPELSAVSELVKAALIDAEMIPGVDVTLRHYRTKASCLQAVVIGTADACAVPEFILHQLESIDDMNLRIMVQTEPVNHFVLAAHRRVPPAARARLRDRALGWSHSEAGQRLLAELAWPGFVVAEDADYDDVRRRRLELRRFAGR